VRTRAYLAAHTDSSRTDRRLTLSGVFAERQNLNVLLQSAEPSRVASWARSAGIHGVTSEESIDASRQGVCRMVERRMTRSGSEDSIGSGWAATAADAARLAEEERGGTRSEEHDDRSSSEDESDALGNVASASSHANSPQSAEDRKDAETVRKQFLFKVSRVEVIGLLRE
jgi:hypothetical protein